VPFLKKAEKNQRVALREEGGNESQQIVVGDQIEHAVDPRFVAKGSYKVPIVPRCFRAAFIFQREAMLFAVAPDRQDSIVIFGITESGQLILRTNLERTCPTNEQACAENRDVNVIQPEGVKHVRLDVSCVPSLAARQAGFAHALQKRRGASRNGINELARVSDFCLTAHERAVHQPAESPIKRLAAALVVVESHKLK
jgi:hypothetical protein